MIRTEFSDAPCIQKLKRPVLTKDDIPYNAALIFNAGVAKIGEEYVMLFRNDYGDYDKQILKGTNLGLARSKDGVHWTASEKSCFAMRDEEIHRVYDPRLTVIDGKCYRF